MTILDSITGAFLAGLQAGIGVLGQYSIALLGVTTLIAFYFQVGPLLAMGSAGVSDAIGTVLFLFLRAGILFWLLVNLVPLADATLATFLQWGLAATPGGFALDSFKNPSAIVDVGFRAANPLRQFQVSLTGIAKIAWNPLTSSGYMIGYLVIVTAFFLVALHLAMVLIEFYLAVMVGAVLIPFAMVVHLGHFAEFSLGWLTGGLVRVLVTAAIVGIATPLFDTLQFNLTAGGDPTFYSALVVAMAAVMFAIVSWVVPNRAAGLAGRGLSLSGATIAAAAATGARWGMTGATLGGQAIRGVSQLLRR